MGINYCPNCSQRLEGGEKFCAACGEPIATVGEKQQIQVAQRAGDIAGDLMKFRELMEGALELTPGQVRLFFELASDKYRKENISPDDFKAITKGLNFADERGNRWSLGVKSGQWYRRENKSWVQDEPVGNISFADKKREATKKAVVFCRNCGAPVKPQQKFCNACGTQRN
jgi:hypothetical protein